MKNDDFEWWLDNKATDEQIYLLCGYVILKILFLLGCGIFIGIIIWKAFQ